MPGLRPRKVDHVQHRSFPFSARKPGHIKPARQPPIKEGTMELLIGFVATLFISLLIFRK
jgi:hypothetical protein